VMDRHARFARNETIFREVNERIEELTPSADPLDILCECGNPDCKEPLKVPVGEYERVREEPTHFLVAPGHAIATIEKVVASTDTFEVVRKRADEGELARETDPRS
jgi:hypothetical protein